MDNFGTKDLSIRRRVLSRSRFQLLLLLLAEGNAKRT